MEIPGDVTLFNSGKDNFEFIAKPCCSKRPNSDFNCFRFLKFVAKPYCLIPLGGQAYRAYHQREKCDRTKYGWILSVPLPTTQCQTCRHPAVMTYLRVRTHTYLDHFFRIPHGVFKEGWRAGLTSLTKETKEHGADLPLFIKNEPEHNSASHTGPSVTTHLGTKGSGGRFLL